MVAVGLFAAWNSQRNSGERAQEPAAETESPEKPRRESEVGFITEPGRPVPFDFFLLAMTSHPAFCSDGHSRKQECRAGKSPPLSIHGLWPESHAPGKYPRDCQGPALDLAGGLERDLAVLMPGMADGLHRHEWRTHGTCSGLRDDDYFELTLRLAREVNEALGATLDTLAGQATDAAQLREYAERVQPGIAATLTFHCRTLRDAPRGNRQEPYLVEIRQCVSNGRDQKPAMPIACAAYNRRDQGCGRSFRVAG